MFRGHNQIGRFLRSSSGHAVRAGIMSVSAFGIIAAGLYLYLVPGASANIPFSSPLGISDHDSVDDGCPVAAPGETLFKTDLQSGPCSQEMVDLTGEGDTLYSLLNANLLDEVAQEKSPLV